MPASARVEIDYETLIRLLARGQVRLCELHCLDAESKRLLRHLGLHTCMVANKHRRQRQSLV